MFCYNLFSSDVISPYLKYMMPVEFIYKFVFIGQQRQFIITVHTPLSREVFWHEYAKIPRHTSQNSIAAGNLE